MVDTRRVVVALGRLLVGGVEVALASMLVVNVLGLGYLRSVEASSEQAGTFVWAFLFGWGFTTAALAVIVGAHLVVNASLLSSGGPRSDRRVLGRTLAEAAVGTAVAAAVASLLDPSGGIFFAVIVAPTVLAWAVLVHYAAAIAGAGRSAIG